MVARENCTGSRLVGKQRLWFNIERSGGMRKSTLFTCLVVISLWGTLASPQSPELLAQHIWGTASNGMCVGVCARPSDWATDKNDIYCDIDVRNVTTNRLYIWIPPLEHRYEIALLGPDHRRIRQLKPLRLGQQTDWLGREPSTNETHCLDWCFLKETFEVRTNGLHTLVVSVRANAFTNFAAGRSEMKRKPVYFLLPSVTNTIIISPPGPSK
jgi:hypothetical protein